MTKKKAELPPKRPARRSRIHCASECFTCNTRWSGVNALGVAAQHARWHPDHKVYAETGFAFIWETPA